MTPAHFTEVLFIGFFTAAGVYSALIYLISRDRPFLIYAALMDATGIAQLVFAGDLFGLSTGSARLLVFRSFCYAAFFVAQAAFAWTFLPLKAQMPRLSMALSIVLALNLAALGAQLGTAPAGPYQMLDHALFFTLLAVCGAAGVRGAATGGEAARFYTAGFFGAALGIALSALAQLASWGNWPEYFFQLGVAWQGLMLALALAAGYAKLDPLTGVKSRRAFDERLTSAWRHARKHGKGLALILVAAAGVAEFEAKNGRVATDQALRRIAHLCSGCCRDRADLVARYGDQAFAAIVPGVSRAQANEIAARIRTTIAVQCLLPVGVGVSSIENAVSAEALLQQAARRGARDAIAQGVQYARGQ
jgi:diguanylate cyclase (GGDEF)-like protein